MEPRRYPFRPRWLLLRPRTRRGALVLLHPHCCGCRHCTRSIRVRLGLRAGEALRLTDTDVDLEAAVLRVRDTKFGKSRLVPVALDVVARLRACRAVVARHVGPRAPDAPFFPAPSGGRYSITALGTAFHNVLIVAGVPRWSGGRSLRLHDLRHSFVAIRLLLWCEQDADLAVRLPGLATYLGHVGLSSAQRYLQLSHDLVGEITRRHEARFGYLITDR